MLLKQHDVKMLRISNIQVNDSFQNLLKIYHYDQSFLYIRFINLSQSNFNFKNKVKNLNLIGMKMNNTLIKLGSIQKFCIKYS